MLLKADPEQARAWLEQAEGESDPDDYPVWPGNARAVQFFVDLARCWVVNEMTGQPLRLDRGEILATSQLLGIKRKRRRLLFRKMQMMEGEALEALRENAS